MWNPQNSSIPKTTLKTHNQICEMDQRSIGVLGGSNLHPFTGGHSRPGSDQLHGLQGHLLRQAPAAGELWPVQGYHRAVVALSPPERLEWQSESPMKFGNERLPSLLTLPLQGGTNTYARPTPSSTKYFQTSDIRSLNPSAASLFPECHFCTQRLFSRIVPPRWPVRRNGAR